MDCLDPFDAVFDWLSVCVAVLLLLFLGRSSLSIALEGGAIWLFSICTGAVLGGGAGGPACIGAGFGEGAGGPACIGAGFGGGAGGGGGLEPGGGGNDGGRGGRSSGDEGGSDVLASPGKFLGGMTLPDMEDEDDGFSDIIPDVFCLSLPLSLV
nr:unnamed protein product [Haemonchus contortus]